MPKRNSVQLKGMMENGDILTESTTEDLVDSIKGAFHEVELTNTTTTSTLRFRDMDGTNIVPTIPMVNQEVINARTTADGTSYASLRRRLEAEYSELFNLIEEWGFKVHIVQAPYTDLNTDYRKTGFYYFPTGTTPFNMPDADDDPGTVGWLLVLSSRVQNEGGTGNVKQMWFRASTNSSYGHIIFSRTVSGTAQSPWQRLAIQLDLMTKAAPDVDMNTLNVTGVYFVSGNYTNNPTTLAGARPASGVVQVINTSRNNTGGIKQIFYRTGSSATRTQGETYIRYYLSSSDTWSDWVRTSVYDTRSDTDGWQNITLTGSFGTANTGSGAGGRFRYMIRDGIFYLEMFSILVPTTYTQDAVVNIGNIGTGIFPRELAVPIISDGGLFAGATTKRTGRLTIQASGQISVSVAMPTSDGDRGIYATIAYPI